MEKMSPYQAPNEPALPPELPVGEKPKSPKVFGILNICFGVFGALMLLLTPVWRKVSESMASMPGQPEGYSEKMSKLYEPSVWTNVTTVWSGVLAVLLIVSGVLLVKYKNSGRKVSNVYAWLSIANKLFVVYYTVAIQGPIMQEAMSEIGGDETGMDAVGEMMGPMMTVSGIISGLIYMTYPILTLCFLNKKQVKASLS